MQKYGIENVPHFFLPSPPRRGFFFFFFPFLNVPWQIKTTRCILLAPQIMYVYRETERDKILLTIMVEFMVSILLAGSVEGKSRAGAGEAKSDYSCTATTEGRKEILRSGRFLRPPLSSTPPPPPRAKPGSATKEIAESASAALQPRWGGHISARAALRAPTPRQGGSGACSATAYPSHRYVQRAK